MLSHNKEFHVCAEKPWATTVNKWPVIKKTMSASWMTHSDCPLPGTAYAVPALTSSSNWFRGSRTHSSRHLQGLQEINRLEPENQSNALDTGSGSLRTRT